MDKKTSDYCVIPVNDAYLKKNLVVIVTMTENNFTHGTVCVQAQGHKDCLKGRSVSQSIQTEKV